MISALLELSSTARRIGFRVVASRGVRLRRTLIRTDRIPMSTSTKSPTSTRDPAADGPPAPLLTASFFLAGLGTVILGPLLPQLLQEWSLTDQRGGLLLLAKFAGAFLGGVSVPRRLRLGIMAGHLLAAAGFTAFAFAHGLALALPALFVAGLGLGEIIASTNILAGRRWPQHTGSALALINLFWSLGAVSTGLLVAALLPRFGWRGPTLGMAALLLVIGLGGLVFSSQHHSVEGAQTDDTAKLPLAASVHVLPRREALRFGALLFLYGGLETCLTAWLTTYALRFTGGALLGGQSGFVVLWSALTAGRALAAVAMRRWPEIAVQRLSLMVSLLVIGLLTISRSTASLSLTCILLGLALAPIFPSTFGLLLRRQPSARSAGAILAVSGLGAAVFPWLMGAVSTHTGSLRVAMVIPALLIPVMLSLTLDKPAAATAPDLA